MHSGRHIHTRHRKQRCVTHFTHTRTHTHLETTGQGFETGTETRHTLGGSTPTPMDTPLTHTAQPAKYRFLPRTRRPDQRQTPNSSGHTALPETKPRAQGESWTNAGSAMLRVARAQPAPPRTDPRPGLLKTLRREVGVRGPHLADQLPALVDAPRARVAQESRDQLAAAAPPPPRPGLHPGACPGRGVGTGAASSRPPRGAAPRRCSGPRCGGRRGGRV